MVLRRRSQVLASVFLVLALSSVFFGVGSVWAVDGSEALSMSAVEDVSILGSGDALVTLLMNVADSPLADMYRDLLAAPSDAGVGEEMPIPENKTEDGAVMPVRQEFHRSIKEEQMSSFGFATRIFNSSMVPMGEQGEFGVSINAVVLPQIVSITDVGSDVILEVVVGPKDENATEIALGFVLTKIAFAQMMLESLEGEQVYELEWTTRIKVPAEAALLNGDELAASSWAVNFGGGTSMSASVDVDGSSTIVLSERTLVSEQNMTVTLSEIFEAFSGYKVFTIRYQLPKSALEEGEGTWTSGLDRDWSKRWDWSLSFSVPFPFSYTRAVGDAYAKIEGTLTVTPTLSLSVYMGWDFDWNGLPHLDWFKTWISVDASIKVRLDATITIGVEHTWETTLFDRLLHRFTFSIGSVPVWADLKFSIIARLTVGAEAEVTFWAEAEIGASFKAGAEYDGGWSPISETNFYASLDGPHVTSITVTAWAEAFLGGRLSLMIYSVTGPFVEFGPYIRGEIKYHVLEEVAEWTVRTGLKLNVGVTFRKILKKLLDLNDYYVTLGDWTIKTWEGHWGEAVSSISINLEPTSTYLLGGTMVTGLISSPFAGSKRGTVHIEYSTDGDTWNDGATIQSNAAGEYSKWLVWQWEAGTFYVRSRWEGNIGYKPATSDSVVLSVSSVVTGPQWLLHYDDEVIEMGDQFWPTVYSAVAVHFTPPSTPWKLEQIEIYGLYIGDEAYLDVRVWDSDLNDLFAARYQTSVIGFPKHDATAVGGWVTIDIPDIIVSGDFYIVAWGPSPSEIHEFGTGSKIEIGEDHTPPASGHSYIVDAYRHVIESTTSDHNIRAAGISLVEDHYMYAKRYVPVYIIGFGYVYMLQDVETDTFYIDEDYAYSMVKFRPAYPPDWPAVSYGFVTWEWYKPGAQKGGISLPFLTDTFYYDPERWDGIAEATLPIAIWPAFYEPYLGRPFKVEIYWNGILAVTETFRVIKRPSSISLTLSSDSITYGQSVQISSQISPSFSDGTTTLQYSVDDIEWNDIAADTPSDGYYSQTWVPPHAGTYYIRAVWSGTLTYAGNTSETLILTVNRAPTDLSTSLSSTTIIIGSTVTITTTLTSAITGAPLEGKDVTIQFSLDGSTWYTLSPETTDSAGQSTYEWTPDLGVYYIRSIWYGDDDYFGANSPSIQLTVEPSRSTMIEIVGGADAEVDRVPDATAEFAVRVKDQLTGQYLTNIGRVEFYVSDQSFYSHILVGSDTDDDADGIYLIQWNIADWPVLGPQPWSAYFTGTAEYMPSSATSTFTIYYYGVALWIDPTFQEINITETETHTINFKWNRDTQDTFDLSLTGLDPSWYTLSQTSITVSTRGQTEQITLTISPPNAPTILKDYEFTVTATSQADPSFSVSATATARVDFTPTLPPTPTGGLATAVQPKTIYMSPGTTIVVNILVINNQNFDDTVTVDLTTSGIPEQYQASLAWFDWTTAKVFLPAGGSIYIPLEITVPAETPTNMYVFRAVATSTADPAIAAADAGIIRLIYLIG